MPRYFDEQIANMRAGLARGYSVPRVSVVGRDKTIEPYVKGETVNPSYTPFVQMPATISAADQASLRAEAATLLRDVVAPAYVRLLTMMREEYLRKTRTTLAATAMPDGDAVYQAMIEKYTTLTLTAQQIHDIGLNEVARIEAEWRRPSRRGWRLDGRMPCDVIVWRSTSPIVAGGRGGLTTDASTLHRRSKTASSRGATAPD